MKVVKILFLSLVMLVTVGYFTPVQNGVQAMNWLDELAYKSDPDSYNEQVDREWEEYEKRQEEYKKTHNPDGSLIKTPQQKMMDTWNDVKGNLVYILILLLIVLVFCLIILAVKKIRKKK